MGVSSLVGISFENSKDIKAENPIVQHLFAPDPAPFVYNDRVYVYTTHDEDITVGGFYTMLNWHCFSTDDMVNWTAHGQIFSLDDLAWANDRAWAAQCVERNGKFYLYVPVKAEESGICIGVGVSDSPEGPFVDAIGGPLIDEGDWNDIDPTVYIDDDGQAYLYFGNPELRYVKLNEDMISVMPDDNVRFNEKKYKGLDEPIEVCTFANKIDMTVESFGSGKSDDSASYAEGPWFYKRNGLYYMVYPAFGASGGENISYSTSESPTGPWVYGGKILEPNNCYTIHPGVCDYKGKSYLFYHNNILDKSSSFHRSMSVEEFSYNEDGSIDPVDQTLEGVSAVANLDPYKRVEAETIAWCRGVDIAHCVNGGCNVINIHNENFIKVKNVDFGTKSPLSVTVNAACASADFNGTVEFRIDCDEDLESEVSDNKELLGEGYDIHNTDVNSGDLIATVKVGSTDGADKFKDITAKLTESITGVHDLFIVFRGTKDAPDEDEDLADDTGMFKFDYWSFEKAPEPATPTPVVTAAPVATAVPGEQNAQATPSPTPVAKVKVAKVKGLKIKKSGKKATVSWQKASGAKKYEVYYGTNKNFKKATKKIVAKNKVVIKKLKKGKTYYFKVRGFANDASGKKVYGSFSTKKKVRI
ncbi:MAG: carbohydrate-binding protein [Lachnospiraceae bacterium]|nr:carbohydrate-binding protein [Lachnospiraceae bacterium]